MTQSQGPAGDQGFADRGQAEGFTGVEGDGQEVLGSKVQGFGAQDCGVAVLGPGQVEAHHTQGPVG